MSKGFGKKALQQNKKGSKANSSQNSPSKTSKDDDDDNKLMVKFVFEGEKFHARTPICFDQLNLSDLLRKINLDITLPPPSAQELFEAYFKEDIYPYIRHNIQSQIRNKRDITKLWDLQSIILQNIYIERAKLIKEEWTKRRAKNGKSGQKEDIEDTEAARKKAELKAKNKLNKQRWKEQMALQIASGAFDEPQPVKKKENDKEKKKKEKKNKKQQQKKKQPTKPAKKKKVKKWKDKKVKKEPEWPSFATKPVATSTASSAQGSAKKEVKKGPTLSEQLKQNLQRMEMENNNNNNNVINNGNDDNHGDHHLLLPQNNGQQQHSKHNEQVVYNGYNGGGLNGNNGGNNGLLRNNNNGNSNNNDYKIKNNKINCLIKSQLKYKMVLKSNHDYHLISDQDDFKQIEGIKPYIDNLNNVNELNCIKIWIYFIDHFNGNNDDYNNNSKYNESQIWLNTDKDQVQLKMNQSKLFEILWNDFGNAVKKRIDSPNIDVVFIKKSKALRLKIPVLSI